MENMTTNKTLQSNHIFHVDHSLGAVASFSNIPNISGTK